MSLTLAGERNLEYEVLDIGYISPHILYEHKAKKAVARFLDIAVNEMRYSGGLEIKGIETYKQSIIVDDIPYAIYFKKCNVREYIGIMLFQLLGGRTYTKVAIDIKNKFMILSEIRGMHISTSGLKNGLYTRSLGEQLNMSAAIGLRDRHAGNIIFQDDGISHLDLNDYNPQNHDDPLYALNVSYNDLMYNWKIERNPFEEGLELGISILQENFKRNSAELNFYLSHLQQLSDIEVVVKRNVEYIIEGELLKIARRHKR